MTIDIKQLKADRDAGTQGEWMFLRSTENRVALSGGTTHLVGRDEDHTPCAFVSGFDDDGPCEGKANARRIARVPDMEARILSDAARIAALEAKVKAADELLGFIDAKISWEINPSNYDHQQVCEMNASWIEIGLAVAAYREVQS